MFDLVENGLLPMGSGRTELDVQIGGLLKLVYMDMYDLISIETIDIFQDTGSFSVPSTCMTNH